MLRDERYTGIRRFGKWEAAEPTLMVVEKPLWEQAQPLLTKIKQRVERKSTAEYPYYFQGLILCPHCGEFYTNGQPKRSSASINKSPRRV
jgi:hypothetical protein